MQITDVKTTLIEIPHAKPTGDATLTWAKSGSLFVNIETDAGLEGLGFTTASPAARATVERVLKPRLIGRDPMMIERLWSDMFLAVRGTGRKGVAICAISAVDTALWDLKAKLFGAPLYRLLGPYRESVPIYGSGGWTTHSESELVAEMTGYVERGIRAVKMKVAKDHGQSPAEDLQRLRAVRRAVGDDVTIYVDANGGYYAKQAIGMSRRFEEYGVAWFEEPVVADDIDGLAAIARATTIPVASGEHEYTKFGFKELISRGGCDIPQPDVWRVGGITEWLKVAHLAEAYNLPVAPHAAQLIHLHLACAIPNLLNVEFMGSAERETSIMFREVPQPSGDSWAPFADRPGLGLELDPAAVEKYGR